MEQIEGLPASSIYNHEFRVAAVAGFVAAVFYSAAYLLFPKISDALNPGAIDLGMTELAAHSTLALVCQQLFAIADIAMIVFLFGLAAYARSPLRSLAWLGSFLFSISFGLDLIVVGSVVSATMFFAPHAAHDVALHAAGLATLGFASVLDFGEGFLWMAGLIVMGVAAWRGGYWPRWLAALAVVNGILSVPYLPTYLTAVVGNILFVVWAVGVSVVMWRWE